MFKKELLKTYIGYSVLAAVLFSIPMIEFVRSANFNATWWLYVGNALFMVAIAFYMLHHIQGKKEGASAGSMVIAGHITTIAGIILSCIISFIVISIYIPGIFSSGRADTVLQHAPAQQNDGKTKGLVLMVFMNAIIGNIVAGSFTSIMLAYTAKLNQTKDKKPRVLE